MTEYIKREDAINAVRCVWLGVEAIQKIPAADVAEVRHATKTERVIDNEFTHIAKTECSLCDCQIEIWHKFCPWCGAKMDADLLSGYIPYEDGGY